MLLANFREYCRDFPSRNDRSVNKIAWLWNMNVGDCWATPSEQFISSMNGSVVNLSNQWNELSILNSLLAETDDLLIVSDEAEITELYEYWKSVGVKLAKPVLTVVTGSSHFTTITEAILDSRNLTNFHNNRSMAGTGLFCFGNSDLEEKLSEELDCKLIGAPSVVSREVNSKCFIKQLCGQLSIPTPAGRVCQSWEELYDTAADLFRTFQRIIVKEPYGSSGKGMVIIKSRERLMKLVDKYREMFGTDMRCPCWIVEGWYENALHSFNSQYLVRPDGEIRFVGIGRQLLKNQVYEGSAIASDWHLEGSQPYNIKEAHRKVADHLYQKGYTGLIGIDSLVTTDKEVFPVIEVNARMNMSTYAFLVLEALGANKSALLKSYTMKRVTPLSLHQLQALTGPSAFYSPVTQNGVFVLAFTGNSSVPLCGVLRMNLLYIADTPAEAQQLQHDFELMLPSLKE